MWKDFYHAGGWGMYPTTIIGFTLIAVTVLYLLRPEPHRARLVMILAMVTFASGLLGTLVGICNSAYFIPEVAQAKQLEILALGCQESLHVTVLALLIVTFSGLIAAMGAARAVKAAGGGLTAPSSTGHASSDG
jgi:hypothetical protein